MIIHGDKCFSRSVHWKIKFEEAFMDDNDFLMTSI